MVVRVTLVITITICSIYLPPKSKFTKDELQNLINQLPEPYIILGDFNGHNPLWGGNHTNGAGKITEDLIQQNQLYIFNDGSYTYLHPGHGTYSAIDLTLCSPSLAPSFDWEVTKDTMSSDHFPIFLTAATSESDTTSKYWNFKRADWHKFTEMCNEQLTPEQDMSIESFTDALHNICNKTIPKTKQRSKPNNQWFDQECKNSIQDRKKAQRQYFKQRTAENLKAYKISRARAKRIIKQKKRESWKSYVSSITEGTPPNTIWKMIRKMKNKGQRTFSHLKLGQMKIETKKDIVNTLAETFLENSSSNKYNTTFLEHKYSSEQEQLDFTSDNLEVYNKPLSLSEIKQAIDILKYTSAGPDEIHNEIIKHLPQPAVLLLLKLFNKIWQTGSFPDSWRTSTIIPIPKPGKDHSNPSNYRPIALTSCICKVLERIINKRLTYFLEVNNLLAEEQNGFRQNRSTIDHLIKLEKHIKDSFSMKQHTIAVFFDIEKAYDTVWRHGVIRDLHDMGLRGLLPTFINNFLKQRSFHVKSGQTSSDCKNPENGLPQGSILS